MQFVCQKSAQRGIRFAFNGWGAQFDPDRAAVVAGYHVLLRIGDYTTKKFRRHSLKLNAKRQGCDSDLCLLFANEGLSQRLIFVDGGLEPAAPWSVQSKTAALKPPLHSLAWPPAPMRRRLQAKAYWFIELDYKEAGA